jgi:hypothetical protein
MNDVFANLSTIGRYLLVAALVTMMSGCGEREQRAVCVIVPAGFRGAIQIRGGVSDGELPDVGGDYDVFHVPPSGLLRLRCAQPGEAWREWRAAFADGTPLVEQTQLVSWEVSGMPAGLHFNRKTDPALWTLYARDDGSLWLYVGTEEEYKIARSIMRLTPGQMVK